MEVMRRNSDFGGNAARVFPAWPVCDEDECEAALRVLRSGRLNYWTGTEGRCFERDFADHIGCRHAVAVANGTAALELALAALDIGAGQEVIVPSRTFVASASAVARCGATPVFADVDRTSQNVTVETVSEQLTPRTAAVIVVHLAGWPCDMEPIVELAKRHRLAVVEDCAQAHGARYKGRPVGAVGDVGAYSFCQDKIMTTGGEGGMVVTNRNDVWERVWSLKEHGKNPHIALPPQTTAGFRWLHERIGTNWRMTEVQAAIGRVALGKLAQWVDSRRRNAAVLHEMFGQLAALRTTLASRDCFHSYYKFYTFVCPERLGPGWDRDRILRSINNAGIPCFAGSCSEVYRERAFDSMNRPSLRHAVARELGETSLMFPVHPTLTDADVQAIGRAAAAIIHEASIPVSRSLVSCDAAA